MRRTKNIKAYAGLLGAVLLGTAVFAAGCGRSNQQTEPLEANDTFLIAGLEADYNNTTWVYSESESSDDSMVFYNGNTEEALVGIIASRESTYQDPQRMIMHVAEMVCSYDDFEILQYPQAVEVDGDTWYEWMYSYVSGGITTKVLQRCYGENYYGYNMTYMANADSVYDAHLEEALAVMDSARVSAKSNQTNEEAGAEFISGEWDAGDGGYVVFREDGTYSWYMTADMDESNVHYGKYYCDPSNEELFDSGDGYYVVIFPEKMTVGGEDAEIDPSFHFMFSASMASDADENDYVMMDVNTLRTYYLERQE